MDEKLNQQDLLQGGEEDFATMFRESVESAEEGQVIHGVVIKLLRDFVAVDINRKAEGMIPHNELTEDEKATLKAGDPIDVMVERYDGSQGFFLLSRSRVLRMKVWDDLQKAFDDNVVVHGTIVAKVKGGYTVDIGVRAFLPGSQVDIRPVKDTDPVLGLQGNFKLIKFSRKKANVVVSRRVALEEDREVGRKVLLEKVKEGDVVEARVKNITDYGVFMDLGGLDGLMHITDMSHGKVGHPSDLVKVGDLLQVKVIRFDAEKGRISLGMKQLKSDPWGDLASRLVIGAKVDGRVMNVTKYGAFIEIEEGVEGLLHVSEMSWGRKLREPSELLKAGERVDVVILRVDADSRKISLGMRQLLPNPWDDLAAAHPEGAIVEGTVKNVADFGVFIDIGGEIDGLIHVSDLSWNQRIKNPGDIYKKGDKVTARVIRIDRENQKFSLSLKHMAEDPWDGVAQRFPKGTTFTGKIVRVADFGVFIEVAPGVEGLAHVSELSREKVDKPSDLFKPGDEVGVVVLGVETEARKISLSVKGFLEVTDRKSMETYMSQTPSSTAVGLSAFGEALKASLSKKADKE